MNTHDLLEMYQAGLRELRQLRERAGFAAPDLKDAPDLRQEALRFADRLAIAPDAATVEMDLLADHSGAQSFWFVVATQWEALELLLLPSAFELIPKPLPFEVLAVTVRSLLQVEGEVPGDAEPRGEPLGGSFGERASEEDVSQGLSPRKAADGSAGAVWAFSDVY